MRRLDPRGDQLIVVHRPEVEPEPIVRQPVSPGFIWLACPPVGEPPVDLVRSEPCIEKRRAQLRTDLVAARADARAERRLDVRGPRAEPLLQRAHGVGRHACHGSAPPRVRGRHRAAHRVGQQQRDAVGYLHRYGHVGIVSGDDVGVPSAVAPVRDGAAPPMHEHGVTVHLLRPQ